MWNDVNTKRYAELVYAPIRHMYFYHHNSSVTRISLLTIGYQLIHLQAKIRMITHILVYLTQVLVTSFVSCCNVHIWFSPDPKFTQIYMIMSIPSFRNRDNSVHLHECSPFWVGIFITFNNENYHFYCFV